MPFITVETNLSYSDLPTDFGPALSKSSSEILDKPEERISISLITDRRMWRNGSDLPMMQITVSAVGAVSTAEKNVIHAKKFTDFICDKTGLSTDRISLLFLPIEPWQVGRNGTLPYVAF